MDKKLIILFYLGISLMGFTQIKPVDKEIYQVYFMPRYPEYGWMSNPWAIWGFDKKESVLEVYEQRSYYTTSLKDSIFELYYKQIEFPAGIFNNLEKIKDTLNPLENARARIVIFNVKGDTIIIDSSKLIYNSGMCYKMTNEIWNILFAHMPPELAENWLFDREPQSQNDTYLRN